MPAGSRESYILHKPLRGGRKKAGICSTHAQHKLKPAVTENHFGTSRSTGSAQRAEFNSVGFRPGQNSAFMSVFHVLFIEIRVI